MRAGRLISLVSILGREGRTTAGVLAQRLEVSERTILRDLEVLSGSGVPVYAVRGPGGGFQLLEGCSPSLPADAWLRPADGEDPDRGWVTATCRMRSVSSMAVEVLALGPHVEVLAPGDLRDHVAELARRTSALYG